MLGDQSAIPSLLGFLKQHNTRRFEYTLPYASSRPSVPLYWSAAILLGRLGVKEAVPTLTEILSKSPSPEKLRMMQRSAYGNDMFEVGRAIKEAIAHARDGKGPYFIEFKTYRLAPHHTADQCLYRDQNECDEAAKSDPIPRGVKELLERKWTTEEDLEKMTKKCNALISEAVGALREIGLPDPATVLNHTFES